MLCGVIGGTVFGLGVYLSNDDFSVVAAVVAGLAFACCMALAFRYVVPRLAASRESAK